MLGLGLCFVDRGQKLINKVETQQRGEKVTGNVDVEWRQNGARIWWIPGQHQDSTETDTEGWRETLSFSGLIWFVSIISAKIEDNLCLSIYLFIYLF